MFLLAVVIIALATLFLLTALALGAVFPALGNLLMQPCEWLTHGIVVIVRHCGESDWVFRAIESPPFWAIGLYYAVLLTAAVIAGRRLRSRARRRSRPCKRTERATSSCRSRSLKSSATS